MSSNRSLMFFIGISATIAVSNTVVNAFAFNSAVPSSSLFTRNRTFLSSRSALQAKRESLKIDRTDGKGDFKADVILPEDGEVKGMAFFMHGFSQYPKAYRETLKTVADEAKIGIVAVLTGTISDIVIGGVLKERESPQYLLQKYVSADTAQCIQMVKGGDESFSSLGIPSDTPKGLIGHSMGGALCYYVASLCKDDINYVFTMAPVPGEPEFAPKHAIKTKVPNHSMNLAGNWDLIGRAGKVEQITKQCNEKMPGSSIYVEINRGVHTGFEDTLVLFNLKLSTARSLVFKILDYSNFTVVLVLKIVNFLRGRTGQIEITRTLMSYFMTSMVEGKKTTNEGAMDALKNDPDIKDKWIKKVELPL